MFKHLCPCPQISSGFFLFGWLVFCLFICGALFLCSFFCFYAAGLNISCQQTGINRTPLRNEVKVNVLALSTIGKLLRKLIMHCSTLFALCAVPGLVCFPLLPFLLQLTWSVGYRSQDVCT